MKRNGPQLNIISKLKNSLVSEKFHMYIVGISEDYVERIRKCGTPAEARALAYSDNVKPRDDW